MMKMFMFRGIRFNKIFTFFITYFIYKSIFCLVMEIVVNLQSMIGFCSESPEFAEHGKTMKGRTDKLHGFGIEMPDFSVMLQ